MTPPPVSSCATHDATFDAAFGRAVEAFGLTSVRSAPSSPWQNPYVERVIGSIRRECLDHVIVFNQRHLRRVLRLRRVLPPYTYTAVPKTGGMYEEPGKTGAENPNMCCTMPLQSGVGMLSSSVIQNRSPEHRHAVSFMPVVCGRRTVTGVSRRPVRTLDFVGPVNSVGHRVMVLVRGVFGRRRGMRWLRLNRVHESRVQQRDGTILTLEMDHVLWSNANMVNSPAVRPRGSGDRDRSRATDCGEEGVSHRRFHASGSHARTYWGESHEHCAPNACGLRQCTG